LKKINFDNESNNKSNKLNFDEDIKENDKNDDHTVEKYKIVNSKKENYKKIIFCVIIVSIILFFLLNAIYTKTQKSVTIDNLTNYLSLNNNLTAHLDNTISI
jgi:hypothetical protein